jgi:hypothetical protein
MPEVGGLVVAPAPRPTNFKVRCCTEPSLVFLWCGPNSMLMTFENKIELFETSAPLLPLEATCSVE